MPSYDVYEKNIVNLLVESGICPSKSEARRLVIQGGIVVDNERIVDPNFEVSKDFILKKGKKNIYKIILK